MALTKTIKGVTHYAYSDEKEFRNHHPDTKIVKDWRKADEGQWCLSDDGQVVQVLKRGVINKKYQRTVYVRTIIGMVNAGGSYVLKGGLKKSIYRFSNRHWYDALKNGAMTEGKRNFAKYIAHGANLEDAYKRSHPGTKSKDHAVTRAKILLKSKEVRNLVDKETEMLMSKIGCTKEYLLENAKKVIDKEDARDGDKLRALETLMKISGLLTTEKKVDSVALIQEFTGFSRDKLNAFSSGILPEEKTKELKENN